jgi:hypothetical protein
VNLAPITLFVYNRPWHTRQTIEALQKNDLATESDLFIYADGPKKAEHAGAGDEVREYIRGVDGFKSVTIVEREENWGLARSIISGVTEVVNSIGRIIVLEDDLLTSPFFLRYMNDALDLYDNEEGVISIHAYTFPLNSSLPETFFLKGTGCWGWATWERSWKIFEPNGQKLLENIIARRLENEFDLNGAYPYTRMLKDQISGKNDSWAVRWHASGFLKDKLTLHYKQSFTCNIGFDGSGTHCHKDTITNSMADHYKRIQKTEISPNAYVAKMMENYFRGRKQTLMTRIKTGIANYWK